MYTKVDELKQWDAHLAGGRSGTPAEWPNCWRKTKKELAEELAAAENRASRASSRANSRPATSGTRVSFRGRGRPSRVTSGMKFFTTTPESHDRVPLQGTAPRCAAAARPAPAAAAGGCWVQPAPRHSSTARLPARHQEAAPAPESVPDTIRGP